MLMFTMLNSFLLFAMITVNVFSAGMANFYTVSVKNLVEFVTFWEVLVYQI